MLAELAEMAEMQRNPHFPSGRILAEMWQNCRVNPPTQCGGKGPITGVSEAVRMVLVIFGPLPLCVYGVYGVGGCVWLLGVFMGVTFGMRPLYVASRGSRNTTPFG